MDELNTSSYPSRKWVIGNTIEWSFSTDWDLYLKKNELFCKKIR